MRDKAYKIAFNSKYDGYQSGYHYHQWFTSFLIKKSSGSGVPALFANKSGTEPNYQLPNELHREITRKFKRRKVNSSFRDNVWGVDLTDMQSLSKYNKGTKYLFAIDLFSEYVCVAPLKDKKRNYYC